MGKATIGVIFRDWQGKVVDGFCEEVTAGSSFMVKALALQEALALAKDMGYDKLVFVFDCEELIICVKEDASRGGWSCAVMIEDIRNQVMAFSLVELCWSSALG